MQSQLVKDIGQMNEKVYRTYLDVFQALKNQLPKSIFYEKEKILAGVKLTAISIVGRQVRFQSSIFPEQTTDLRKEIGAKRT